MLRSFRATSLLLMPLLSGCAVRTVMPGFRHSPAITHPALDDRSVSLPPRRQYFHSQRIETTHDSSGTQIRLSVTTHRGSYFLWIQHPRITFFYDLPSPTTPPAFVSLLFRTVDPQLPATNRLRTTCDGTPAAWDIRPTFWVEPGPIVGANLSTYDLPVPEFAGLVRCQSLVIDVGGIRAEFRYEQLEALRDLASQIPSGSP